MPDKIKVEMIIDGNNGIIEFEGEYKQIAVTIFENKLKNAREEGKQQVVQNVIKGIEKLLLG